MFSLTIADFFNAPEVNEVDMAHYGGKTGAPIVITAHDDLEVARATVGLTDSNGAGIENGEVVQSPLKSGR